MVTMALSLAACREVEKPVRKAPDFTERPIVGIGGHSDILDVSIQVSGIYDRHEEGTEQVETTLVVVWSNKTDGYITYGDAYRIERLEGDQWVDCALEDRYYDMIGHAFKGPHMINVSYVITNLYDLTIPGDYRFSADCTVDTESGPKTYTLWSDFRVE